MARSSFGLTLDKRDGAQESSLVSEFSAAQSHFAPRGPGVAIHMSPQEREYRGGAFHHRTAKNNRFRVIGVDQPDRIGGPHGQAPVADFDRQGVARISMTKQVLKADGAFLGEGAGLESAGTAADL